MDAIKVCISLDYITNSKFVFNSALISFMG